MKTFRHVDGIKLAVEIYAPENGTPPFSVVLACHGIPSGRKTEEDPGYRSLAMKLAAAGFLSVIFNFRGCGESGGHLDLAGWCRDLRAVLDLVTERDDVDARRLFLLGFSGGAAVSCQVAAEDRRVAGVVLAACPAELSFLFKREELAQTITRARQIGTIRDDSFPPDPLQWLESLYTVRPETAIACLSGRPLLMVHGREDELVPVEHAKQLYELAGEPKELLILEGAGHQLRREERAMSAAMAWLQRQNKHKSRECWSMLEKGLRGETKAVVAAGNTAKEVGSGSVAVFATPMLVALMESAAISALRDKLPAGQTTVGTKVEISHTAATPLGMTVTAQAELIEVEGRRLVFTVVAQDEAGLVGEGRHERFIVDMEKFISRAEKRKDYNAWMDS